MLVAAVIAASDARRRTAPLRDQQLPVFAPEAVRADGAWRLRLAVLDGAGLLQHWHVHVPAQGAASLEQQTVARDLDVGDLGGP